jgi:hypothetical protein
VRRLAAGGALGLLAGLALGWQLWRPRPVVETPAAEVRQPDGSLVLERAPDPSARPRHQVPRGATVERVATVTVQPDPVEGNPPNTKRPQPADSSTPPVAPCRCAPVHVDLSLVRLEDGTRRVIASARGGTVIGGVDIPVESAAPDRELPWAIGVVYEWERRGRAWGVALDRDLNRLALVRIPLRVGGHVTRGAEWRAGIRVSLRF